MGDHAPGARAVHDPAAWRGRHLFVPQLGRAEDPSFTIKSMVVQVAWPGATAAEMQTQVADKIEKKLQELPYLDRVESYSQPGVSFIRVTLIDKTPPAR
jgi:multidrug efflux pump subunit AcrB